MHVRRLRLLILALVGLCILSGVVLLVAVLNGTDPGPVYRGKHVAVWFREYAFSSNAPVAAVRVSQDGRMVVTQIRGGKQVNIIGPTNPAALPALLRVQMGAAARPASDPEWEALQALGSNAVPYLISQLHGIPFEPTYTRAFTNLPVLLQRKLPQPMERYYLRVRALEALGKIGDPNGVATPVLVDLLRKRELSMRSAVYGAIRSLGVDRRLTSQVVLELGAKGRHADVLEITENLGWKGDDVTRLLGTILKSPDVALRRRAIVLLERAGTVAAPAQEDILLSLTDSDAEVRYLSVRALESMGASSPGVAAALKVALNDSNIMVQTVARRILLRIATGTIPAGKHEPATTLAP